MSIFIKSTPLLFIKNIPVKQSFNININFLLSIEKLQIKIKNYLCNQMGCLKLTYQNFEPTLKVVYKNGSFEQNNAQRFLSVDPLADIAPDKTPYHFVSNNPINRIDPLGLTDYTLNRKTGEVKQVGEANDKPDRILRTNRKGEIKYRKRGKRKGEAKVAIDDIEQGILSDGQNFKTDSHLIEVGGKGQPSEQGVEAFALKLSDYVGVEIAGSYFSTEETEGTTHVAIGRYQGNSYKQSFDKGTNLNRYFSSREEASRLSITGFFHTHPNGAGISVSDRTVPSRQDRSIRDNALRINPNLRFFLLTAPTQYGDRYPKKIDYTTGYSYGDR